MTEAVFFDSKVSVFKIHDGTQLRDISPYVLSVDGLPGKRDLNDVTTFGAVGHRWNPSLENADFTLELLYSEDVTYGADTVVGPMRLVLTARGFEYFPAGAAGKKYSGNCMVDDYNVTSRIGNMVVAKAHFKVDNGVART